MFWISRAIAAALGDAGRRNDFNGCANCEAQDNSEHGLAALPAPR